MPHAYSSIPSLHPHNTTHTGNGTVWGAWPRDTLHLGYAGCLVPERLALMDTLRVWPRTSCIYLVCSQVQDVLDQTSNVPTSASRSRPNRLCSESRAFMGTLVVLSRTSCPLWAQWVLHLRRHWVFVLECVLTETLGSERISLTNPICVCVCVCACVRACVRACVCV